MHPFERWLAEHFGATPPLGHALRRAHEERWLRLHSLPGSKRYAETADERAEVRRRARAAASEVLPSGSPIWLVTGTFDNEVPTLRLAEAPSLDFDYVCTYSNGVPLLGGAFTAYATETPWPHSDFDRLIDAIAEDRLRAVWISSSSGEAFAPYDGGIDLIVETTQRLQTLRRVFPAAWFSSRPDRL